MITLLTALSLAAVSPDETNPYGPVLFAPEVFSCSPVEVDTEGTITIKKANHSLSELSVLRPAAIAPHFLIVGAPPQKMRPLMSPEEFADATAVTVRVSELQGLEWRVGAASESVFTVAGVYHFHASEVLESEVGGYSCSVHYVPSQKRTN